MAGLLLVVLLASIPSPSIAARRESQASAETCSEDGMSQCVISNRNGFEAKFPMEDEDACETSCRGKKTMGGLKDDLLAVLDTTYSSEDAACHCLIPQGGAVFTQSEVVVDHATVYVFKSSGNSCNKELCLEYMDKDHQTKYNQGMINPNALESRCETCASGCNTGLKFPDLSHGEVERQKLNIHPAFNGGHTAEPEPERERKVVDKIIIPDMLKGHTVEPARERKVVDKIVIPDMLKGHTAEPERERKPVDKIVIPDMLKGHTAEPERERKAVDKIVIPDMLKEHPKPAVKPRKEVGKLDLENNPFYKNSVSTGPRPAALDGKRKNEPGKLDLTNSPFK